MTVLIGRQVERHTKKHQDENYDGRGRLRHCEFGISGTTGYIILLYKLYDFTHRNWKLYAWK